VNSTDAVLLGGDGRELRLAVQRQVDQQILARLALQNFSIITHRRENFAGVERLAAVVASNHKAFSHQDANVASSRQLKNVLERASRLAVLGEEFEEAGIRVGYENFRS
jgi:hypothetical protein